MPEKQRLPNIGHDYALLHRKRCSAAQKNALPGQTTAGQQTYASELVGNSQG
jgi:hypothetical protein